MPLCCEAPYNYPVLGHGVGAGIGLFYLVFALVFCLARFIACLLRKNTREVHQRQVTASGGGSRSRFDNWRRAAPSYPPRYPEVAPRHPATLEDAIQEAYSTREYGRAPFDGSRRPAASSVEIVELPAMSTGATSGAMVSRSAPVVLEDGVFNGCRGASPDYPPTSRSTATTLAVQQRAYVQRPPSRMSRVFGKGRRRR